MARKRRDSVQNQQEPTPSQSPVTAEHHDISPSQQSFDEMYEDLVAPMISPGAGLKHLDNSDQIFDSIFGPAAFDIDLETLQAPAAEICLDVQAPVQILRGYGSDSDILNGYYIFVHPFFPILPPPESPVRPDSPLSGQSSQFEPSSPISLALSAILALIPHPDDKDPKNGDSVLLRRKQAQLFAQLTLESIEIEAEILASVTSPAEALSSDPSSFRREHFHPRVPLELESILAFLVLSIYEYAQRGNLVKMRNRASQAHDAATRLSLHEDVEAACDPVYGEARRRAWWMTYICILQGSIVSATAPIIPVNHRQFRTPLPTLAYDPRAWSALFDAQQCILKCTQYTVALKKALSTGSDLSAIRQRMLALNDEVDSLLATYSWSPQAPLTTSVDTSERVLAASLYAQAQIKLNSAKIKLHRYRAFSDTPIFTRRHCDLEQTADRGPSETPNSCCSSLLQQPSPPLRNLSSRSSSSSSESDRLTFDFAYENTYDSISSAKLCLKAALAIGRAFESLPYPNPTKAPSGPAKPMLSTHSTITAPRTMPG